MSLCLVYEIVSFQLIAHQLESNLPVTTKSGAILKRSVPRETWELNNDDVELVEKIGSVRIVFSTFCSNLWCVD